VGRIKHARFFTGDRQPLPRETRIRAALGAMAMQDVEIERACDFRNRTDGGDIAKARLAAHRNERKAQLELGRNRGEASLRQAIGRIAIRDDADEVPTLRLLKREIVDMPEQPADRRAHDVEDAKGRLGRTRIGHVRGLRRTAR
jgi:hypothetical protein